MSFSRPSFTLLSIISFPALQNTVPFSFSHFQPYKIQLLFHFLIPRAGLLDLDIALQTVSYLQAETDYIPWKAGLEVLDYIDTILQQKSSYGLFQVSIQYRVILLPCACHGL